MAYSSRIPQIVKAMERDVDKCVERAGYRFEAEAKRHARVRYGYMRGQIRFYPHKTLTGAAGWSLNKNGGWEFNPASLSPGGRYEGIVIGGANYTIFNEYGTRYMSAKPMFAPAAEVVRPLFRAELAIALQKAVG